MYSEEEQKRQQEIIQRAEDVIKLAKINSIAYIYIICIGR
jgi:hypothetical protein